jgi:hypothetical protein
MNLVTAAIAYINRVRVLSQVFLVDMNERNAQRPWWKRYPRATTNGEAWALANKILTEPEKQAYLKLFNDELDSLALLEDLADTL